MATALGSGLDLYVWLRAADVIFSRRVLQLVDDRMYSCWEPSDERAVSTAILDRAYSELLQHEGRVVFVRLRDEVTRVLWNVK